ncbi:CBU_0585 family protein [Francisella frigiditurris]|uniref:Uncharacterized protein n=1 Tax=Francisella frigiditurris TaxID=1542390 RepID=A0A1J0KUQ1_9GAMM|nr:CBU_0585 family protein [Francisella frigiditurris]APC97411.1 hypothetical protein KX01_702 [Francisella frigiditurris]
MNKILFKMLHLFDNKKNRQYVSDADILLTEFDKNNPQKSASQKKEILKHRNIHKREPRKETSFLDS